MNIQRILLILGKGVLIILAIILTLALLTLAVVYFGFLNKNDRKLINLNAQTIKQGDNNRKYRVYMPRGYDKSKSYPMLMMIHGYRDYGRLMGLYTGAASLAERENLILVLPEGSKKKGILMPKSWNATICCDEAHDQKLEDSKLLFNITKQIEANYSVDTKKEYVAGFSNGAMMTQRLVVDYPDQYKAMAVVGGAIGGYNGLIGPPDKSINALFINGEKDTTVPPKGRETDDGYEWLPRSRMIGAWTKDCTESDKTDDDIKTLVKYSGCDNGSVVEAELYHKLAHTWPGARHRHRQDDIAYGTERMWQFFKSI
ncbi:hypothetical protein KA529_02780 [Candidatus Saccharibacteria bacterium]|nr:hypothetical protein [Candidatus Saccharibacteria bacterium]